MCVCLVSRNVPTRDLVNPNVSEQMRFKCSGMTFCLDLLGPKCHNRNTLSTSRSVVIVLLDSRSAAALFAFVRSRRLVMSPDVQTQVRVSLMKNRDHVVAETCVTLEVLKQQSPRSIWQTRDKNAKAFNSSWMQIQIQDCRPRPAATTPHDS